MTEDMEHLPNSTALKTYIRCAAEESGSLEKNSNKFLVSRFADFFADITREEQDIYFRMGKGCLKRARTIVDPLEYTYAITVCFKENDNKVI